MYLIWIFILSLILILIPVSGNKDMEFQNFLKYLGKGSYVISDQVIPDKIIKEKQLRVNPVGVPDNLIIFYGNIDLKNREFSYAFNKKYIYPVPEFISHSDEQLIKKIQNYSNPVNPEIKMQNNVFDDSEIPGGTKQRGAFYFIKYMQTKKISEIVYAGPSQGVAQVAIGVVAKELKIKARMFYSSNKTKFTERAIKYKVALQQCKNLYDAQQTAEKYVSKHPESLLLPFGLNSHEFRICLIAALRNATRNINKTITRMWVVIGSATLINCLYYVFPETYFMAVQVGKTVWPDQILPERTRIFIYPGEFVESAQEMPPFNSVETYDAKIWYFYKRYGNSEDFIWNVAG